MKHGGLSLAMWATTKTCGLRKKLKWLLKKTKSHTRAVRDQHRKLMENTEQFWCGAIYKSATTQKKGVKLTSRAQNTHTHSLMLILDYNVKKKERLVEKQSLIISTYKSKCITL